MDALKRPIAAEAPGRFARWRPLLRAVVVAAGVLALGTGAGTAATDPVLERAVKAAFLYKFMSYVEWPSARFADANAPYVLGVQGAEGIEAELRTLVASRPTAGRPIEIKTIRRGDPLSGLHALFIGGGVGALTLPGLGAQAQQHGVLVISEGERVPGVPSAINMVVADGRVRFDVNTGAAERAGIKLSSRLLAVARSVRAGAEP